MSTVVVFSVHVDCFSEVDKFQVVGVEVYQDVLRLYVTVKDKVFVEVAADRQELLSDVGSNFVVLRSVLLDKSSEVEGSKGSFQDKGELVLEFVEIHQSDDVVVIQGVEEDSFSWK